jgi:hypothetical protein
LTLSRCQACLREEGAGQMGPLAKAAEPAK